MEGEFSGPQLNWLPRFLDERGYFTELYNAEEYPLIPQISQISRSFSVRRTIRGLHVQVDPVMAKVIHVVSGLANFYLVDMRTRSHTFTMWQKFVLYDGKVENLFLYVPEFCAVGFEALEDTTVEYFHSAPRNDKTAVTIHYKDNKIGIPWMIKNPIISRNDSQCLSNINSDNFSLYEKLNEYL